MIVDQRVNNIQGQEVNLSDYRGRALLIVNVASECGYTKQYAPLQELYERYHERGFEVLGFPCNDFGAQEPGDEAAIAQFCESRFGVTFPLFEKVNITSDPTSPLYEALQNESPEGISGPVRWNFTKFLVSPEGKVVARFEPNVAPLDAPLIEALEAQL